MVPEQYLFGSMIVNLATSIPQNKVGAQYKYGEMQSPIKANHFNLCGYIALEMIYETTTGKKNTLGQVYASGRTEHNEGQGASDLAYAFANDLFLTGWKATTYISDWVCNYQAGRNDALPGSGQINTLWHRNSSSYVREKLMGMLQRGHYLIALVNIDLKNQGRLAKEGIPHWVVVTYIDSTDISINNPYSNRSESYSWTDFYNSFRKVLIELIPPPNTRRNILAVPY